MTDELAAARERDELRSALLREKRAHAKLKADRADLAEAARQGAYDATIAVGKSAPIPRPGRDRRRSPEVAVLHMTDWQLGKVTRSYDSDICEDRVRRAVGKARKLAEIARADHPVRQAVLLLGGDHVENVTIFPGQAFEVDSTAYDQVVRAAALIETVVLSLLEAFESVTVYEVAGNHGRIGRKGDSPYRDNLDRFVYLLARQRLDDQSSNRLTWHENESWYTVVEVGNYRAMLTHGDAIKSFGGNTPAFGILRKATAWASGAIPESFSDVYMGHFHTPMMLTLPNGGTIRVTGSPESDNQYAAEFVAARGKPSQRLVFVSPDKGRVTADYVLWLDD